MNAGLTAAMNAGLTAAFPLRLGYLILASRAIFMSSAEGWPWTRRLSKRLTWQRDAQT
jgi:hypothetical protein